MFLETFLDLTLLINYNQCATETQRNMERFYFSATLFRERVSLKNGNVEHYSLKESFESSVLWKLTISPTESLHVQGYVEKIENRQFVQFEDRDTSCWCD